jgi:NAD+ diphosphatase
MKINYCIECGKKTFLKKLGDDFVQICPDCKRSYQDIFYTCAIIVCVNELGKIAVIKQSYGTDKYVLVAGFCKPLEKIEDCCIREVREELGLEATNLEFIGSFPMEKNENLMMAFKCNVSGFIKLSEEVKEVRFVSLDEAKELLKDAKIAYKVINSI